MTDIGEALQARLDSAKDHDAIEVNFFLQGEPAADALAKLDAPVGVANPANTINQIKRRVQQEHDALLDFLRSAAKEASFVDGPVKVAGADRIQSFWITNAVAARVTRRTLDWVLNRKDVVYADLVRYVDVAELLDAGARDREPHAARARSARASGRTDSISAQPTWSVERINAPLLWELGLKGKDVLAAVIDTGVNYEHPDLAGQMWDGGATHPHHGYDFAANDLDPMDQEGHGTCCAGIVAGNGSQGQATGVAPEARVMALRVGGGEDAHWLALQFAIDRGVHVISMSITWKYPWHPTYPGWRRICQTIHVAGVLHANSIGNQGKELATHPLPYNIATPGNCPPPRIHPLQTPVGGMSSAIGCGATDDSDRLADYSGRGPAAWEDALFSDYPYARGKKPGLIKPDLCAPGPGTTSCNFRFGSKGERPYTDFDGTSAATPHVAGCLALLAEACLKAGKPIIPAQIQEALENTAARISGQTREKENHYGAGRVDVFAAYRYGQEKGWW